MGVTCAVLVHAIGCSPVRPAQLTELQRVRSGDVEVILLSPTDALRPTRNYCTLEFRTGADHHLVDVGTPTVHPTMTMEGEPMSGVTTDAKRVATGRYEIQMVLAMTGTWRITVEWRGGTAAFSAVVK